MRFAVLMSVLLLAGCGAEPEQSEAPAPAEQERQGKTTDTPPPTFAGLESISFPDIEENDLFGAGCSFIGTEDVGATLFIAMDDGGYFKTGGEVVTLAPDPDSRLLPYDARGIYSSETFWAELALTGEGTRRGSEVVDYDGALTLRDGEGGILFQGEGLVECGA